MTVSIDLTPEEASRLETAARTRGLDSASLLRALIPAAPPHAQDTEGQAILDVLKQLDAEDTTDDVNERAIRAQEWHELEAQLKRSRLSFRETMS